MASAADSNAAEKPKLVAVGASENTPSEAPAVAAAARPAERKGAPRGLVWVLALLLLFAGIGLAVQTRQVSAQNQRIESLLGQVEGLQAEVSAANTRIQTYEMQVSLVRDSLADVIERLSLVHELVARDPLAPEPAPEPAPQP